MADATVLTRLRKAIEKIEEGLDTVSSDHARRLLGDDATDQAIAIAYVQMNIIQSAIDAEEFLYGSSMPAEDVWHDQNAIDLADAIIWNG